MLKSQPTFFVVKNRLITLMKGRILAELKTKNQNQL